MPIWPTKVFPCNPKGSNSLMDNKYFIANERACLHHLSCTHQRGTPWPRQMPHPSILYRNGTQLEMLIQEVHLKASPVVDEQRPATASVVGLESGVAQHVTLRFGFPFGPHPVGSVRHLTSLGSATNAPNFDLLRIVEAVHRCVLEAGLLDQAPPTALALLQWDSHCPRSRHCARQRWIQSSLVSRNGGVYWEVAESQLVSLKRIYVEDAGIMLLLSEKVRTLEHH